MAGEKSTEVAKALSQRKKTRYSDVQASNKAKADAAIKKSGINPQDYERKKVYQHYGYNG